VADRLRAEGADRRRRGKDRRTREESVELRNIAHGRSDPFRVYRIPVLRDTVLEALLKVPR
jgi:hypothetical protein